MKKFTSALLTVAFAITLGQPNAGAQEASNVPVDEECKAHAVAEQPDQKVGRDATGAEKEFLEDGLVNGKIPHVAPVEDIDLGQAVAVEGDTETVYRLPLAGEFEYTNYILVRTSNDDIDSVAETQITKSGENDARLQIWIDGKPEFDDVVRESDAAYQTRSVGDAWSAFNSCLSNAGVPWAVVTGLSLACGFLGTFTAGVGAPACLIAAAGGYAATVSFCYGRALKAL